MSPISASTSCPTDWRRRALRLAAPGLAFGDNRLQQATGPFPVLATSELSGDEVGHPGVRERQDLRGDPVLVPDDRHVAGVTDFKFEVSGHTDSSGKAEHNKELSGKRAAVIVKELVARGIAPSEIISVGMGSERPLVTPDNTAAKKAKNRRYEIQVRI